MTLPKVLQNVREYNEEYAVELRLHEATNRVVLVALNEGGYNWVAIDVADLLAQQSVLQAAIKEQP